jgi:hypothetical protein
VGVVAVVVLAAAAVAAVVSMAVAEDQGQPLVRLGRDDGSLSTHPLFWQPLANNRAIFWCLGICWYPKKRQTIGLLYVLQIKKKYTKKWSFCSAYPHIRAAKTP